MEKQLTAEQMQKLYNYLAETFNCMPLESEMRELIDIVSSLQPTEPATGKEPEIVFIVDGKHKSKPYTPIELLGKDEIGVLEDMEVCDCPKNESVNNCEGGCLQFENSKITGFYLSPVSQTKEECVYCDEVFTKEDSKVHSDCAIELAKCQTKGLDITDEDKGGKK